MKKITLFCAVIALIFTGCNTSNNPLDTEGDSTDVVYSWGAGAENGYINETVFGTVQYPGYTLELSGCPNIEGTLGDMSEYGSIILEARLYDFDKKEITTDEDGLAQFSILSSDAQDSNDNRLATAYNMKVGEAESFAIPDASGVPTHLFVQSSANPTGDTPVEAKVGYIRVHRLTLKLKTGGVVLESNFGSQFVDVSGDTITFNNATYSDGAAQFAFPEDWNTEDDWAVSFAGKKLVFSFTLENADPELEHQIHIQAAHADDAKDKFNGRNTQPGQKYITLDDNGGVYEQEYDEQTGTGKFAIPLDELILASKESGNANDLKGPFDLNAVRIVNNGTVWTDPADNVTHNRNKSYTLIFNSITVE